MRLYKSMADDEPDREKEFLEKARLLSGCEVSAKVFFTRASRCFYLGNDRFR